VYRRGPDDTDHGARSVETLLGRIGHGLAA